MKQKETRRDENKKIPGGGGGLHADTKKKLPLEKKNIRFLLRIIIPELAP